MDAKNQDKTTFESLRNTTYQLFLTKSGIDLKKLRLTDIGFCEDLKC
jgi:hypothetical protein